MAAVLIIDEDAEVLAFVADALTAAEHHPVAVRSVAMAETLLASQAFDAIVLEMVLQDRDGVETIPKLRLARPHCAIIAMSAGGPRMTARSLLAVAAALGADATLPKPFSTSDLIAALETALVARLQAGARPASEATSPRRR